ncbi:hypothetical protein GCM10009641_76360 [Mycobacterium cookii]|uniref:Integral membrane protein n=2 Tax=Nocardioides furvisabuli TaxID=375542 RepID=A0ABP5J3G2_9ACTN
MMMWLFSAVVGGVYGFTLVWVAVLTVSVQSGGDGLTLPLFRYVIRSVAFALAHATAGLVCGLLVGVVLTLVVGGARDFRTRRAARLAGGLTHAAVAVLLLVLLGGGFDRLLWMVVTSVLVGLVAGWWHDRLASRPRVEDFYAH